MEINTLLLLRYFEGKSTPREEVEIDKWLAGDSDGSRSKKFKDARFIFEGMTLYRPDVADVKASATGRRSNILKRVIRYSAAAAVAVFMLIGTATFVRNHTIDEMAENVETVYVPSGKTMELTLEDGSRLWLNSGTTIEYPTVFGRKSRNVRLLSGEVLFNVTRDESRPFTVSTFASDVRVLGTKFDVLADEKDGLFRTSLINGSVSVSSKIDKNIDILLKPSQEVCLTDGKLVVSEISDLTSVVCWTDGLINLADIPFDKLMQRFEKAYNVKINIDRTELPVIRYSRGKVRVSDGVDHALEMLSRASDFTWTHDKNTNLITIR